MKTYAFLVTIAFVVMFTMHTFDGLIIKHQQEIINTHAHCTAWCEEQWNDYGC